MDTITWEDFQKVELRLGTIVEVEDFPGARKPAYKVTIDFGPSIGLKKSSAQITQHYRKEELVGTQVICVVNFPSKQVGKFMSEVLITGFEGLGGGIVLARTGNEAQVPNGARLV